LQGSLIQAVVAAALSQAKVFYLSIDVNEDFKKHDALETSPPSRKGIFWFGVMLIEGTGLYQIAVYLWGLLHHRFWRQGRQGAELLGTNRADIHGRRGGELPGDGLLHGRKQIQGPALHRFKLRWWRHCFLGQFFGYRRQGLERLPFNGRKLWWRRRQFLDQNILRWRWGGRRRQGDADALNRLWWFWKGAVQVHRKKCAMQG
jgi:hypothetical protein